MKQTGPNQVETHLLKIFGKSRVHFKSESKDALKNN